MSATPRPRKLSNCVFDRDTLEAPPEGISLSGCLVRGIRWEGCLFPRFFACGSLIESCDFRRARLENGYFGGGENAGFQQTLYRDCKFDEAVLDGMSFGTARFERCSFRDVQLRKWLSFSAEFVDCIFAGYMPEAAFLGRSPLRSAHRRRNEF